MNEAEIRILRYGCLGKYEQKIIVNRMVSNEEKKKETTFDLVLIANSLALAYKFLG